MDVAVPLLALVAMLILGVPIAFSMMIAGVVGAWMVTGSLSLGFSLLGSAPLATVENYLLSTVPMFILLAYFTTVSRLTDDVYRCAANWLSRRKGGLGIATILASGVFGALSGSTIAGASALGAVAVPNMDRYGYARTLSTGTAALGSTLAVLIPPSVLMIIYGVATNTSIGALLVAGIVPGVVLMVLLAGTIWVWVTVSPNVAPMTYAVSLRERLSSSKAVWPMLLLIVLILVLLYSGAATPTEVAALGALAGGLIAFLMRRLGWSGTREAMSQTIRSVVMVFTMMIGGTVFGRYLALSRFPQEVASAIQNAELNRWVVIFVIILGYFLLSMFMDEIPLLLVTLPFTFPIVTDLGFSPVWFGVVTALMVITGLVFPPVGLVGYVVSSAAKVDPSVVFKGSAVLLIPVFALMVLLMLFPAIALWLPDML